MTDAHEPDDGLAALLALDALDPDEQADAELRVGTFPAAFGEVSARLADGVAEPPPHALRGELLMQATQRRAIGAAIDGVPASAPIDAFAATVEQLAATLASLTDSDFDARVRGPFGRVRDLVAHLAGIEDLVLGWLGVQAMPDAELALDHVEVTRAAMNELAELPAAELTDIWHRRALRAIDTARSLPGDLAVQAHDIPTHLEGMLLLRTFEVWAHHEDIAVALGRELPDLDAGRGRVMSSRLAEALPLAVALTTNAEDDAWVRLVLTGDGGGTYDVMLGGADATGDPDALVVTGVVDLCRVAARRLTPAELGPVVEGDEALAHRTLAAASAFARD